MVVTVDKLKAAEAMTSMIIAEKSKKAEIAKEKDTSAPKRECIMHSGLLPVSLSHFLCIRMQSVVLRYSREMVHLED